MKYLKKFNESVETTEWWNWKKKYITNDWFNNAPEEEIDRFAIGYNDGQGDHGFYTFSKIVELLKNSDRPGKKNIENMTRVEIIDEFYDELMLNSNNSDMIYFDGKEYLKINWK
jgi:hypothetical protein